MKRTLNKVLFVVLFAVLLMGLLAATGLAANETYTVTRVEDDENEGSLRWAITQANETTGATIAIADSIKGETIALESALPTITKSMTIEGNSIALTLAESVVPDRESRLLNIDARNITVTIRRVHFKDGRAGSGVALHNTYAALNLESCIFNNNRGTVSSGGSYTGGAIYTLGATVNVRGCTFYNNYSYNQGGAMLVFSGAVTLTGNVFYGNTARGRGDVIYDLNGTATSGGYNVYDGTSVGFTFDGTIDKNNTVNPVTRDSFFPRQMYAADGVLPATLPSDYPEYDFYGQPIVGGGSAGAVQEVATGYIPDYSIVGDGTIEVTSGSANKYGLYEGNITLGATSGELLFGFVDGVRRDLVGETLTLEMTKDTTVVAVFPLVVNTTGDVTDANDEYLTLREAITEANKINDGVISIELPDGEDTITLTSVLPTITKSMTIRGGGVTVERGITGKLITVNSGGSLTLENITIDGNKADYLDAQGQLVYVNGGSFTMKDGAVLKNNASGTSYGGGVFVTSSGTFNMEGGEISGNAANYSSTSYGGGGVYVGSSGSFTMSGGKITGNSTGGSARGGGVFANGAFVMTGGEISGNTTSSYGGGVHVHANTNSQFTMQGGEIFGNTVGSDAGGVYLSSGKNIVISEGFANSGGIYIENIGTVGGEMPVTHTAITEAAKQSALESFTAKRTDGKALVGSWSGDTPSARWLRETAEVSITAQPTGSTTVELDTVVTLTVEATATGTLSYQWYESSSANGSNPSAVGTDSASYTVPTTVVGTTYYYCVVSTIDNDAVIKTATATSKIVFVKVTLIAGATVGTPTASFIAKNRITVTELTISPTQTKVPQTVEYAISRSKTETENNLTWQDSASFTGLTIDTDYYVYARSKENSRYAAGTMSVSEKITTALIPVSNSSGSRTIIYSPEPTDISDLFTLDTNAGTPTYTLITDGEGVTGTGQIEGSNLTVIKSGVFKIRVDTAITDEYASGSAIATLTVNKAPAPAFTFPTTAAGITYGQTLQSATLNIVSDTYGTFSWTAPTTMPAVSESGNSFGVTYTPNDTDNYDYEGVTITTTVAVTVAKKGLAGLSFTAANKTYDGTTSVVVTPGTIAAANGLVGSDDVSFVITDAVFENANAGTGKTVNITTWSLSGAAAGNYSLPSTKPTATADITRRELTGLSFTAANKTYDGTTSVVVTPGTIAAANGLVGSDDVSFTITAAAFENANAGTGKTVNITTWSLRGTAAGNYSLPSTKPTTTADIAQKTLTITAHNKTAHVGGSEPKYTYTVSGLVGDDTLTTEPTLIAVDVKMFMAGDYVIAASDAVVPNANYNPVIIYEEGKLTISHLIKKIVVGRVEVSIFDDNKTLVSAEADMKNAFSSSVEVSLTDNASAQETLNSLIGEDMTCYAFDINFYIAGSNTTVHPINGNKVTMTLPLSDALAERRNQIQVAHYSNGELIVLESELKQIDSVWCVIFDIDQSATYALVLGETHLCQAFTDIAGHWGFDAICYVIETGVMNGTGSTTFAPNSKLSRAMMAQILYNLEGKPAASGTSFSDVASDAWYADAVAWASANGIVNGYGNGKFGPEKSITREEMAAILYRYCEYKGITLPTTRTGDFTDSGLISSWAEDAVCAMYQAGILSGRGDNSFDPRGSASRAEVAQMMMNFLKAIK